MIQTYFTSWLRAWSRRWHIYYKIYYLQKRSLIAPITSNLFLLKRFLISHNTFSHSNKKFVTPSPPSIPPTIPKNIVLVRVYVSLPCKSVITGSKGVALVTPDKMTELQKYTFVTPKHFHM